MKGAVSCRKSAATSATLLLQQQVGKIADPMTAVASFTTKPFAGAAQTIIMVKLTFWCAKSYLHLFGQQHARPARTPTQVVEIFPNTLLWLII